MDKSYEQPFTGWELHVSLEVCSYTGKATKNPTTGLGKKHIKRSSMSKSFIHNAT